MQRTHAEYVEQCMQRQQGKATVATVCVFLCVCVSVRCVTDSDIIKTVCFRDGFLGFVYSPTKEISSNDFMIKPWCRSAH